MVRQEFSAAMMTHHIFQLNLEPDVGTYMRMLQGYE